MIRRRFGTIRRVAQQRRPVADRQPDAGLVQRRGSDGQPLVPLALEDLRRDAQLRAVRDFLDSLQRIGDSDGAAAA